MWADLLLDRNTVPQSVENPRRNCVEEQWRHYQCEARFECAVARIKFFLRSGSRTQISRFASHHEDTPPCLELSLRRRVQ